MRSELLVGGQACQCEASDASEVGGPAEASRRRVHPLLGNPLPDSGGASVSNHPFLWIFLEFLRTTRLVPARAVHSVQSQSCSREELAEQTLAGASFGRSCDPKRWPAWHANYNNDAAVHWGELPSCAALSLTAPPLPLADRPAVVIDSLASPRRPHPTRIPAPTWQAVPAKPKRLRHHCHAGVPTEPLEIHFRLPTLLRGEPPDEHLPGPPLFGSLSRRFVRPKIRPLHSSLARQLLRRSSARPKSVTSAR